MLEQHLHSNNTQPEDTCAGSSKSAGAGPTTVTSCGFGSNKTLTAEYWLYCLVLSPNAAHLDWQLACVVVCNPPHVADGLVEANGDEEDDGELVQLCTTEHMTGTMRH
jgi:hypothetical protein